MTDAKTKIQGKYHAALRKDPTLRSKALRAIFGAQAEAGKLCRPSGALTWLRGKHGEARFDQILVSRLVGEGFIRPLGTRREPQNYTKQDYMLTRKGHSEMAQKDSPSNLKTKLGYPDDSEV
jgi:hypothetical protein